MRTVGAQAKPAQRAIIQIHRVLGGDDDAQLVREGATSRLSAEAVALRARLLADTTALSLHALLDARKLDQLKGANGIRNVAQDLQMLSQIMQESWPQIQGKSATVAEDLQTASRIGTRLTRIVGLREQGPAHAATATDQRQRVFTLTLRAYEEARSAVTYLRRREGDAESIAPNLYTGSAHYVTKRQGSIAVAPDQEAWLPVQRRANDATSASSTPSLAHARAGNVDVGRTKMNVTRPVKSKLASIIEAFLAVVVASALVAACSSGGRDATGGGGSSATTGSGGASGTGTSGAPTDGAASSGTGGASGTGNGGAMTSAAGGDTGISGAGSGNGAGAGGGNPTGAAGAGGTGPGTGGNANGGAGGKSGAGGNAAVCLPASNSGACSPIAQGTDYPGMSLTACAPTTTHVAGAITPGGAAVTATKGNGSYTLSNGIVSIVITCTDGSIKTWTYKGTSVLAGGNGGGQVYWELEAGNGTCTLTSDPTTNGGNQAEVRIHTTGSTNNLDVDIDYAVLRGSSGFYATGILTHPAAYAASSGGEWRSNVYNGSLFDWNSLDALRNGASSIGGPTGWLDTTEDDWVNGSAVTGAPKEVEKAPNGVYVCKYSWTADWGDTDAWGWSSSAKNIGMFIALGSKEYYNGGPKKRELMGSMLNGPDLLNMLGGSHYEGAEAAETIPAGTELSKVYGPFFYYNNSVPAGTANANTVLFADAIAQAKAEQAAWPYTWFVNPAGGDGKYAQEAGRSTVTGTLTIADSGAPNASAGDMWIGLAPDNGVDPAAQFYTYQYWVKTACDGSFTIPHVTPGTYALWAFGRGAAGTFTTAKGNLPNSSILTQFTKPTASITVTAGQTQSLGTVTITPPRTAPTVWELGAPDRDSHEFLNGAINYTNWAVADQNYAATFGNGVTYTVGKDDFSKVWNYADMDTSPWTVSFTMGAAPTGQARLYVALAANEGGSLTVTVNGTQVGTLAPKNTSDAVIRLGSHGYFWDGQIVFAASALKAGANTLTIKNSGAALEWDYLRLEAN